MSLLSPQTEGLLGTSTQHKAGQLECENASVNSYIVNFYASIKIHLKWLPNQGEFVETVNCLDLNPGSTLALL